jgi:hypothetical protein
MNKTLVVGGVLLALLIPSAFASSQRTRKPVLCVEMQGNKDTLYDVKLRFGGKCTRGERLVALPRGLRGPTGPRGPAGAAGPAGSQGPAGTQGAAGPAGAKGDKGDPGTAGATGSQGPKGDKGDKGDAGFGTFGPVHLTGQDDTGCGGAEVWAHDTENRLFTVEAAQDGTGYIVTRYDVKGTFTTVPGTHHPGDCANTFDSADTGTFNGVWTRQVTSDMQDFDYNPDAAMPASGSWVDFLGALFGLPASIADPNGANPAPTLSYEFDYYNACDDHWRDASYATTFSAGGSIGDCP